MIFCVNICLIVNTFVIMSLVGHVLSDTTIPVAEIKSLVPNDPYAGKIIYLEKDGKTVMRKLWQKQKARELAEERGEPIPELDDDDDGTRALRALKRRRDDDSDDSKIAKRRKGGKGEVVKRGKKSANEILREVKGVAKEKKCTTIALDPDLQCFELCVNPEARGVFLAIGPAGSGKSHFMSEVIVDYQRHFPDNPCFIFSKVAVDKAFDKVLFKQRILLDEDFVNDPPKVEELKDSFCLFDDIDTLPEEGGIWKAVHKLRDELLEVGRHEHIWVGCTSHLFKGGSKKTSMMKRQAGYVTFFPGSGVTHEIVNFLKTELGLSKAQIESVMTEDNGKGERKAVTSRWVCILTQYPRVCLDETRCFIL